LAIPASAVAGWVVPWEAVDGVAEVDVKKSRVRILDRISKETGGRLFEVSKKQPIGEIYSQIEEELRNQYSIGYTPDRKTADAPGYRKIQLTTKQKDLAVQTRQGYYADR
jgi:VWFA-related protein